MAVKGAELESELIDAVCERVRERLPPDQATPCEAFVRQYYHWVPAEDLADRNPLDLYGAAVAHWNLAQQRAPGEAKVRVYNPELEQHGWQSPHTVIEIVSDDMPFLVDSVTMELSRQGYGIHLVIHPVMRIRRDAIGPAASRCSSRDAERRRRSRRVDPARRGRTRARLRAARRAASRSVERVLGPGPRRGRGLAADARPRPGAGRRARRRTRPRASTPTSRRGDQGVPALAGRRPLHVPRLPRLRPHATTETRRLWLPVATARAWASCGGSPSKPPQRGSVRRRAALGRGPQTARADQGQLALDRPPARLPRLHRRQALRRRRTGRRRAALPRPLHHPRLQEPARGRSRSCATRSSGVLDRAGFPPDSHDAQGAARDPRDLSPRLRCSRSRPRSCSTSRSGSSGSASASECACSCGRDPLDRFVSCLVCIPRDRFNTENRERVGPDPARGVRRQRARLDAAADRVASSSRVHYVVRCADGPPARLRRGHDRGAARAGDRGRGPTTCATRCSRSTARRTAPSCYTRYERRLPARLPRRLGGARGGRRHRPNRGARQRPTSRSSASTGRSRRPTGSCAASCSAPAACSLSDVLPTLRAHGAQGRRRAAVRDHARRPRDRCGSTTSASQADAARTPSASATAPGGVPRGLARRARGRRPQRAGARGALTRPRGDDRARDRQVPAPGGDRPSPTRYMQRTLIAHPEIAPLLVELFSARFDPDSADDGAGRADRDRDRGGDRRGPEPRRGPDPAQLPGVVRGDAPHQLLPGRRGRAAPSVHCRSSSIPTQLPLLPLPRPQFEIFVYSPRVEGVHLRGGRVARGGMRWSDRREDFRTEVLGLMKAQMVKNALIVPVGAKGGFVRQAAAGRRRPRGRCTSEAIACYKTFLSGLLDITDNIVGGEVVAAPRVVRYDDDDPYLVVAADKGTATFSDIANDVSAEYGFWLGDAFASGGSHGYDHKQMGITARGAWESVKRHFRELGVDIQSHRLHRRRDRRHVRRRVRQRHAALAPHPAGRPRSTTSTCSSTPTPTRTRASRSEGGCSSCRARPGATTTESLISEGGGVYSRSAKSIELSPQVQRGACHRGGQARAQRADPGAPAGARRPALERRHRHLRQGLDRDRRRDVGDKANDRVRVDGARAALPRRGRGRQPRLHPARPHRVRADRGPVQAGGSTPTRSTTPPASTASDHEVNIKILLDAPGRRRRHDLQAAQRAAARDDRCGRRAGPVRQLHADPGDQPRAGRRRRRCSTSTRA